MLLIKPTTSPSPQILPCPHHYFPSQISIPPHQSTTCVHIDPLYPEDAPSKQWSLPPVLSVFPPSKLHDDP